MAKKEVSWIPIFGQFSISFFRHSILICVYSEGLESGADWQKGPGSRNWNNDHCFWTVKEGETRVWYFIWKMWDLSIWLYPEGTRSHQTTNELLAFKKGAFHIAISGQIPIIPVVISTYHNIYDSKNWRFDGGKIKIKSELFLLYLLSPSFTSSFDKRHDC